MSDPITGQVAQILNRRELVINRGSEHGVRKGMKFAVLNPRGASIVDPETREDLGSVPLAKVLVEAVRVQDRLSVCRTFKTSTYRSPFDLFGAVPKSSTTVETLRTVDKPYEEELDEKDSYVKIGDQVVQAEGDEFLE
jgi:hypothetical protein